MESFNCPKCGDLDIVKRGKRKNESGEKQRYRCNKCRSTFVEPDGFEHMRHKKEDIVRAVHQHNDGLSLFQVKNHLAQHDNVGISRESIRLWCKKHSNFLKSATFKGEAKAKRKAAF